jgi:hypothetical protein
MANRCSSCIATLFIVALLSDVCEAYSFISSWIVGLGNGQRHAIDHRICGHRHEFLTNPETRTSFLDDTETRFQYPRMIFRKKESARLSVYCHGSNDIMFGFPSIRFRRKEISQRMAATPTSFTNYSSTIEFSNSNIEILRVTPGDYDVRAS